MASNKIPNKANIEPDIAEEPAAAGGAGAPAAVYNATKNKIELGRFSMAPAMSEQYVPEKVQMPAEDPLKTKLRMELVDALVSGNYELARVLEEKLKRQFGGSRRRKTRRSSRRRSSRRRKTRRSRR